MLSSLPHDVIYLLFKSSSPASLVALARTCRTLHAVFSTHKPALQCSALRRMTGSSYDLALGVAYRELSQRPTTPPPEPVLNRALSNHALIARFARFVRSFHCIRKRDAAWNSPVDPNPIPPPPYSAWLRALYDFALNGVVEKSLVHSSVPQYSTVYATPKNAEELRIVIAYTIFILFVNLERTFIFDMRRRVLELGFSLTTSKIMRKLLINPGGWKVALGLIGVKKKTWETWEEEARNGPEDTSYIVERDILPLLDGEPALLFMTWVEEGMTVEGEVHTIKA